MHIDRVTELFTGVREILARAARPFNDDWLYALEDDAIREHHLDVAMALRGFFRGLQATQVIGLEHLDELDSLLQELGFLK